MPKDKITRCVIKYETETRLSNKEFEKALEKTIEIFGLKWKRKNRELSSDCIAINSISFFAK